MAKGLLNVAFNKYLCTCRSFDVSSNVTVRSVALLLESAKRTEDCNAGAFVCHNLWKTVCSIKVRYRHNIYIYIYGGPV